MINLLLPLSYSTMPFLTQTLSVLVEPLSHPSSYKDRQYSGTREEFERDIRNTSTLYVGNLSFYTTEEQIYEFFGRVAPVKRVIMGLDRALKTPCGFCFVEYYTHQDAVTCKQYLDGLRLDERYIRVDLDYGFKDGRQYGRGRRGGQVSKMFCNYCILGER